jgi:large subunit ribosomal protein L20
MPRAKRGNKRLQKRKDILKLARGYRGTKSKLYRHAKEQVERSLNFAFKGRKLKKGAAARANGLSYSQFMHGLKLAEINLDRKILADLAVNEPASFTEISGRVKQAIESRRTAAPAA